MHSAYGVMVVIWNYRTSNGNTFFDDSVLGMSCTNSSLFDTEFLAVVVMVVQLMVAVLMTVQSVMAMAPRGVAILEAWAARVCLEEVRLTPPPLAMMVMATWKLMAVLMAMPPGLRTMPGRVAILAACKASRYSPLH
jgi:hypothetical protein